MKDNKEGTIFIIDISGYSHLVSITDNDAGSLIICNLLESIIDANRLSFSISEIEGDAILFYKYGPVNTTSQILGQFDMMLKAFNRKAAYFEKTYPQVAGLSIKLVAHYGTIGRFSVGCYSKLFGQSVIEAHRLLKNSIGWDTYALITTAFLQEQAQLGSDRESGQACDIYDIGHLCYSYYSFRRRADHTSNTLSTLPAGRMQCCY
jgi:hypothetical protein